MLSVNQFCKRANISRALFYRLRKRGDIPLITRLGSKLLVSEEAAATWLKAHEQKEVA